MALHLIAEDTTPDEPSVLTPSVCPTREGEGIVPAPDDVSEFWFPCPECRCSSCGEPSSTPPICARCAERQADDDAAKAYREGRY